MIDHKHKCIFIHIPRTGGTSIERSIRSDWTWKNFPTEKHILASTAKRLYKDYWNDYFKFSFVRNPWSRMVSMARFPNFYKCNITDGLVDVTGYFEKFPRIEIDPRSESKDETAEKIRNAVYLNILNEELDFVGRFEELQNDFDYVCEKIGMPKKELPHLVKSKDGKHYTKYYDDTTKQIVTERYAEDLEFFGYEFGK